jgi:hypothetical protein
MPERTCSFCGKTEREVVKMIAGSSAHICNECVVLCAQILGEEVEALPALAGQILVRFADGSIHLCDQCHAWTPLVHEGADLEWCSARGFVGTPKSVFVAAVRRPDMGRHAVGSTLPDGTDVTEATARRVIEAFGGAAAISPRSPKRMHSMRRGSEPPREVLSGFVDHKEQTSFLSQQFRIPTINLNEYEAAPEVLRFVDGDFCAKHSVLPVSRAGSSLIVAMSDPTNASVIDKLKHITGYNIEPVIATQAELRKAIARYYGLSGHS